MPLEALDLPYVQRGLLEILILAPAAGLVGTWIVLRGLAFVSHAVGTAAFPGLVLADGLGFAAPLGALGAAGVFAASLFALGRRRGDDRGAEVALVLVGMLALGVILASDVFASSTGIETLLFGSLLLIDGADVAAASAGSALAIGMTCTWGARWLRDGFSPGADAGSEAVRADRALIALVALTTITALTAVGALLVAALFVVPAATARIWTSRLSSWQLASVGLAAAEGVAGVLLSVELNAPPGAVIAVLSGAVFALAALGKATRRRRRPAARLARLAALGALSLVIAGVGCGSDGDTEAAVVATTPVVGDLVEGVAGDAIEVETIIQPNTDPHEYEPRPDDVQALASADLVFAGGGELDRWIAGAMDDSGSEGELVVLGDSIPNPIVDGDELDPHWWHDPRNALGAVETIRARLAARYPSIAGVVGRSAGRRSDRIEELDAAVARCMDEVPAARRKLVTDHDAFGYFAARYGVEVIGAVIPALTTQAQASAGDLADLRETIEREGVTAVFPESSVSGDLARTLAEETGASAEFELYGDSLGAQGSSGETYLAAEAANAEAMFRGFTGSQSGCPDGPAGSRGEAP